MPYSQVTNILLFTVAVSATVLSSCETDYRALDEEQLRRQFHLPEEVRLDTLRSSPASGGGWFGREGLTIRGVFQFTDAQYRDYRMKLNDLEFWSPMTFLHYSPDGAQRYTAKALSWEPLPLPEFRGALARLATIFDSSIVSGYYYCSLIVTEPGERIEHDGGGYHYAWYNRGIHASELGAEQHPTITTFGILDHKHRRLYAWIGFSG
jgi:hypothetical protein